MRLRKRLKEVLDIREDASGSPVIVWVGDLGVDLMTSLNRELNEYKRELALQYLGTRWVLHPNADRV